MDSLTKENSITDCFRNEHLQKAILLVVVLLAVFLAVKSVGEIKEYKYIGGGVPVTNVVTVSGEGEVFAVPDIATFTFSVFEGGKTVEVAQEIAAQKINDMIAYLKREGIDEKDIKTLAYSVNPKYEYQRDGGIEIQIYPPRGVRVLVGFEVRQSITVKVRDTDKAGELLSGIGGRGVSNVSGLQFTIDDEDALKREARKKAIANAKSKAEQLANDLGVKLVRVVSFNESGGGFYPRYVFDEAVGGSISSSFEAPQIPTGENKILSNVSITYEIR